MDDFVLFGPTNACLEEAHSAVERDVEGVLRLSLKARATVLAPSHVAWFRPP
jgi:hypothetical protein